MPIQPTDDFASRHLGPRTGEILEMLAALGYDSLDALTAAVVPDSIRTPNPLNFPAMDEVEALGALKAMADQNRVNRSYLGMGYYGTITPPVILRNILENPGWYTAYTPYQAEIAQGRLEALFTYQTVVQDLTGLPVANASLLDEATAAAEAMAMSHRLSDGQVHRYFVSDACHPQTIALVQTRAAPLGIDVVLANSAAEWNAALARDDYFAVLAQYPSTSGRIDDLRADAQRGRGRRRGRLGFFDGCVRRAAPVPGHERRCARSERLLRRCARFWRAGDRGDRPARPRFAAPPW